MSNRERDASGTRTTLATLGSMGHSDSDPTPDRMLIVRHERLDEGSVSRERFWLGDLNAAGDDVAGALEVWVHADSARLAPVLLDGVWHFADKIHPTQPELVEDPPIKAGDVLPVFKFRGLAWGPHRTESMRSGLLLTLLS